jgi:ABC-2 type transport system ATP-binding protein
MIELNSFSKKYRKNIFSNTSICFPDGKVNFIMGKNGCGKTTLFKCISGLEQFDGNIKFDNMNITEARSDIFVLWDDTPFYLNLSGVNNIFLFSKGTIAKKDIIEKAEFYLDYATMKRPVKTYSYGQKKRLSLVLLDVLKPKYILMDEISNGLDIDTMKILCERIDNLKQNRTIILTGHQFSFYQHIADNVFIKENNTLVEVEYDRANNTDLEIIYNERLNKN